MYEFVYDTLTPEQREAYLERIHYTGSGELTKETLDTLVYLHQCHVPFEDLDIFERLSPVRLDAQSLYNKVVTHHRGGFCFELNGAFLLLLRAMGFDAYSCMARVAANRTVLGDLTHRATVVRLGGKAYVCDVGLGGPMAPFAVEISPERQSAFGETHWVEPIQEGWWLQKRLDEHGQAAGVIVFAPVALLFKDFEPFCQALINRPDSSFRSHRIVNLRTATGHCNLRDDVLTIRDNGNKQEILVTPEEFPSILETYFGLNYREIYQ
mgnify:CR=1 FL=1